MVGARSFACLRPSRGRFTDDHKIVFPYRWVTRAVMLDKVDATKLLTKIRRQWFAKRK